MQYGICNLSVIPLHRSAGHVSEIVSQLLFGETFDILNKVENWLQIQTHADHYMGWIHQRQYLALSASAMETLNARPKVLVSDLQSTVTEKSSGNTFPLLMGSSLALTVENQFDFAGESYHFKGNYISPRSDKSQIIHFAAQYIGAPYLWGGRTHFGIDCSGFTQMAYRLAGFALARDASQQALGAETLSFLSEAEAGDLLFFDNEEGIITHTGILYNALQIIHASGKVRIDTIDHNGIFNTELQKYTHNLRLIKRVRN